MLLCSHVCLSPTRPRSLKNSNQFYLSLSNTQQSQHSVNSFGTRGRENVIEKLIPNRENIRNLKGKAAVFNFSCCITGNTSVLSNSREPHFRYIPCEYTSSRVNTVCMSPLELCNTAALIIGIPVHKLLAKERDVLTSKLCFSHCHSLTCCGHVLEKLI